MCFIDWAISKHIKLLLQTITGVPSVLRQAFNGTWSRSSTSLYPALGTINLKKVGTSTWESRTWISV